MTNRSLSPYHKWQAWKQSGTADSPTEYFSVCENCGADRTGDNEDEHCDAAAGNAESGVVDEDGEPLRVNRAACILCGCDDCREALRNDPFRPNIKFAGRKVWDAGKRKVLSDPAPIDSYSDAGKIILLPPADWQKTNRLFYHSDAAAIARAFPHLYKLVRQK